MEDSSVRGLVSGYLQGFQWATRRMPPGPRHSALRQLRRLLERDLGAPELTVDEARHYLDELGTPEELASRAAAAHERPGRSSIYLAILAAAGTPLLWPLGVPALWLSRYWNRGEKLLGTLVVPGGAEAAFYFWPHLIGSSMGSAWGDVAGVVLPALTALVAFYLVVTFILRVDDDTLGVR